MTNREAIEELKPLTKYHIDENGIGNIPMVWRPSQGEALNLAIKALEEQELPTSEWIEVKTRPCTDEEFEEYKRLFGDDIDRNEFPCFICPMPSDGDEILICTSWGVDKDKCEYDPDYGYGLEERGDWEDVIAWMPLPAPYKKEVENE